MSVALLAVAFLGAEHFDFVVVGGCALALHGRDHRPRDADIVPAPSVANLRAGLAALERVRVGRGPQMTDHLLVSRDLVTVTTSLGPVDVLLRRGREEYDALARDAVTRSSAGVDVRVAALEDVERLRRRFRVPARV